MTGYTQCRCCSPCALSIAELGAVLDARQAEIIRRRYGRDDVETYRSIGARFGVTPERIRQIEQRAMKYLRRRWAQLPFRIDHGTRLHHVLFDCPHDASCGPSPSGSLLVTLGDRHGHIVMA